MRRTKIAFNKAPSQSTYQTKDVKLIAEINNRDQTGTKDIIALNGFYDVIKNKVTGDNDYHFVKREGTVDYPYVVSGGSIRGMHYWEEQDKLYIATSDDVAIITASTGVLITSVTPFLTTSGVVGFTEFAYASGVIKVVCTDGARVATIDASNVLAIGADADFPATVRPYPVFLDGYLFLSKQGTSDIYNSVLDDPLSWVPGDYITAEMLPDSLLRIERLNNYIVAFGTGSIEYFYDAANPSGSPLNRNDTPLKLVGYLGGLATHGNRLYFVAQANGTGPEVMMVQDFKLESMDNPPLRRYMAPYTSYEGAVISMGGHDFYVLDVGSLTYMMDLETRIWTRIAHKTDATFPIKYAVNLSIAGLGTTSLVAHRGNNGLHYFNPSIYQDSGVNFTCSFTTEDEAFDTSREKYMSRIVVMGDRPATNADLTISVSDDDYQTFSTPRAVNLNQEFPLLTRWGRFRKRAFRCSLAANVPMRLRHLEVDYNIGNS